LSFDHSTFPQSLKRAEVVPIYKSGPKNIPGNYKPISIISPFAKIFAKLIYVRLENFFFKNDLISPNQFGFRKGY